MPSSSKIFLVRPCYSSRVLLWDRFRKRDYNSNKNLVCDGRKIAPDRSWFWRGYNLMLIFFFLKKVQILRLSLLFACFFFFYILSRWRTISNDFFLINKSYCTRVLEVLLLLEHTTCNSTWKSERAFDVFMYIYIYERIVEITLYLLWKLSKV